MADKRAVASMKKVQEEIASLCKEAYIWKRQC